jgi:YVTN family beta-propeller protein
VTAVNPSAASFLTLFPSGTDVPNASNLNYSAGQAPTPNSATIPLSAAGQFNALNRFGSVDLIVDINGYYQPSTSVGAPGPVGPAGPANRLSNEQISLMQWHQDPGAATTIDVGNRPAGLTYDGTNIYVTNSDDATISVIDPASGTVTSTFDVGSGPVGITHDGTDLYVALSGDGTVEVIDPATHAVTNTIDVENSPLVVTYDGTSVFVANADSSRAW